MKRLLTHSVAAVFPCLSPATFPTRSLPSLFNIYWEELLEHLSMRARVRVHLVRAHAHTELSPFDSFPSSDIAASLPSCPCLLLFPITNNSGEFPLLLSWGIFITAQSPCPEGLSALNCSTAVVWTLSSKTGPLFANTRWTQGGDSVSTSTAPETKLLLHVAHPEAPAPAESERPGAGPSPLHWTCVQERKDVEEDFIAIFSPVFGSFAHQFCWRTPGLQSQNRLVEGFFSWGSMGQLKMHQKTELIQSSYRQVSPFARHLGTASRLLLQANKTRLLSS